MFNILSNINFKKIPFARSQSTCDHQYRFRVTDHQFLKQELTNLKHWPDPTAITRLLRKMLLHNLVIAPIAQETIHNKRVVRVANALAGAEIPALLS